jgi:BirA family biotin operon repressor/biotin-[acetyl-CoA-carboxylase] ligase
MQKPNNSLNQIVKILNDGEYHNGTTLGGALNITRSAIWKSIKKLIQYGIKIDSAKGKGYMLREPLILLDSKSIHQYTKNQAVDIDIFETLESTNQYLKNFYHTNTIKVCLAEQQTQGKGRMQRQWHSPFGQNIYFSCLHPLYCDLSELSGLSLVISLAITKSLYDFSKVQCHVKWPNDVTFQGKKVSGNLIEVQAESHGACQAIIGIGINVNMLKDEDSAITQPWTSLREITGTCYDRNQLCGILINNLLDYIKRFTQQGLVNFIDEWNQTDHLYNQTISLTNADTITTGIAKGINPYGHLLLELPTGVIKAFSSGDTQIQKR